MSRFIDRNDEFAVLEKEYAASRSSLVILYGRRRVGKTALISEFIKNKHALYYLATEESEAQNKSSFREVAADYTGNPLLGQATNATWKDIFQAILAQPSQQKKVIVIDEFQYFGKSNQAFPSIFQKIWDTMLKDANIMVILCGSLITMMESQTLSYSSPLYGRRTAQIKLRQIPFRYYSDFFPGHSRRELVERYSVTGGVPKYIELFEDQEDILKAIEENVLNPSGFLYEEPAFLLQHEVSDIGNYFSIIKTIAAGNHRASKIASALEIPQTSLPKYLKTLIDLDILEREVPVTESNPEKSKKSFYKIRDNFLQFWFRFIYPNRSYIESGNQSIVMSKLKKNFIDNHVSFVYEEMCRQEIWNLADVWPYTFDKVGRWWDSRNNEIDVMATDSEGGNLLVGECKFWEGPVGINVLKSLEEKAEMVEWNKNNRHIWYVLFSINGFTSELEELANQRDDIVLRC